MPEMVSVTESENPDTMPALALFKVSVMHLIYETLRRRHRSTKEAALAAGVGGDVLSRLRHGRHDRFSVAMLFEIANRVGVPMVIHVERESSRRT
jgi:hypothetical protein